MKKRKTTLQDLLGEYRRLFYEAGVPTDGGCTEKEVDKIRSLAREINPDKSACLVSKWCWWDLECSDEEREEIIEDGKLPAIIKADYIEKDEKKRFTKGHWVRTSFLKVHHPPALFETANTFYILIGPGTRKSIPIDIAFSFS